ncbi:MAG: histidinol dehydrogenase [Treponema sp.]|jgi:histidinol dehydrogenase|nr:histidinol dehydrogenase [Treponema sp.]
MELIRIIRAKDIHGEFYAPRAAAQVTESVKSIIGSVKQWGDSAVAEYSVAFDKIAPASLRVAPADIDAAGAALKTEQPALYDALCYSRGLALRFAQKQRECFTDFEEELEPGLFTGQKNIPVDRAGIYVPAGRFPLLSTVIMTLSPAVAAGVPEIVLCTPPRLYPGESPEDCRPWADAGILGAASLFGGDVKVFACGGAQAVAAMAYGTETVPRCDVIVGPGNKYVTEAKRRIFGDAGIDILAGPTEVLIIADDNADPAWLAADMLAQSEHDADAQAVLVTDSESLAYLVREELKKQLEALPSPETAIASIGKNGVIVLVERLADAAEIANRKAPEHLELALNPGKERDVFVKTLRNYGSLFIGRRSAEVLGDYSAGLNHTLPTSGAARFTGGLSARSFLKTVTTLRVEKGEGADKSFAAAEILGNAEGLSAHAAAARKRRG